MAIYGAGAVFHGQHWRVIGVLGGLLSLGTVFTTSMIYAQLRTVPRWHMPLTPLNFLSLSVAGGALLAGQVTWALWLILIAGGVQLATWIIGDTRFAAAGTTLATATQLGGIGQVRAFEPPHTGTNYLLREFVHVIGRKHATKLRVIALGLMVVVPVILLLVPFSHIAGDLPCWRMSQECSRRAGCSLPRPNMSSACITANADPQRASRRSTIRAMIDAPTGRIDVSSTNPGLCSATVPAWPTVQ